MKTIHHYKKNSLKYQLLPMEFEMKLKKYKISVVEDNPLNQKVAGITLEMMGYEVVIANIVF
ncbi:MAG: hypothetical protein LEGION0398_MBIBDBAK_00109 [Legionellaceae bacterium]